MRVSFCGASSIDVSDGDEGVGGVSGGGGSDGTGGGAGAGDGGGVGSGRSTLIGLGNEVPSPTFFLYFLMSWSF